VRQVRDTLQSGTVPTAVQIDQIDDAIKHIVEEAGKAGAMVEQFQAVSAQLEHEQTELQRLLSLKSDTDATQAIVALKQQETALEAALNVGASIFQKSLLDFLR
jgi:flagellin-like hook-associated protein FlgL